MMRNYLFLLVATLIFASSAADAGKGRANVRQVYSYKCERTFLEGPGVGEYGVACFNGMSLGYLKADYFFHVYQSETNPAENNFAHRSSEFYYFEGKPMCGLLIPHYTCEAENRKSFAVSSLVTDRFNVGVTLTTGLEPAGFQDFFGFVANADAAGNCASDLVPIRIFEAKPTTIPSSDFINKVGELNSYVVAASVAPNFEVRHYPNTGACVNGECPPPNTNASIIQRAPYTQIVEGRTFCALPNLPIPP